MAKDMLNSKDVLEFLKDFRDNSEVILLDEGKEMSELFEIAEARGIKLKGSRDLAGVKFIYAFADTPNKNRAILPSKELLKALPSIIGKPLDIDHERRWVVGAFLDYKWIVKEKKVIAYAVIYKSNFAEEWDEMQNLFKEKKLATSFEIWSDHSKRKVREDGTYELYDMEIAGGAILLRESPAFPGAKVLELAKERMSKSPDLVYASELKDEDIITAETLSKAAEVKKDNAAIQTEVVEGEKKVETKEEVKVETAVETPKVEAPKTEEKIAEATVPPVEEKKPEEPVKAEEPVKEEATGVDVCKCPACGTEVKHERGNPCVNSKCPKCGASMVGKPTNAEEKVEDKKEEPKPVEEAKKEEVKVEEPVKAEEPKVEEPKAEEAPKVEAKVEEPKAEEKPTEPAKAEEKKEEVKAEEPVKEEAKECEDCKKHKLAIADLETKVEFYKKNSVEIAKRREELGEFAKDISDVDILDDKKFSDVKIVKANKELEKSAEVVGTKETGSDEFAKYREEIRAKADGKIKRSH